jgi:predicted RNA-binding protein Jag
MHVALSDRPDLTTCSEGEGVRRHLVIIPKASTAGRPEPGE